MMHGAAITWTHARPARAVTRNLSRSISGIVFVAASVWLIRSAPAQSGPPIDNTTPYSADTRDIDPGTNAGSLPKAAAPAAGAPAEEPATAVSPGPSPFGLTLGVDWTSAYYFRGFRQETSGLIIQLYADGVLDICKIDDASLSLTFGTWQSFQSQATGAQENDGFGKKWYESDLYAGVALTEGPWALEARYYFYTSPSNAFGTIEEFDLTVAFDDSAYLGAWSLNPSAVLAVETGAHTTDGGGNGTYLQLGVAPGFSFDADTVKGVEVSFPVLVGLSLSNYYEGAGGENDAFGFASAGAQALVPLNPDSTGGVWTLRVGVQCLFLGDAARSFNDGNGFEVIGTVGVSLAF